MTQDPDYIINWRRLDERLTTSGQPTAEALGQIADIGVRHVINLAPPGHKDGLPDEAEVVFTLGMGYTLIPVDFDAPTENDFVSFCKALADLSGQAVHIHCIYNARVSAFFTRYARARLGLNSAAIEQMMHTIWKPGGVWAEFLGDTASASLPNRYAGYDY